MSPTSVHTSSSDGSEWTAATRARLEQELARVRDERRELATSLAGEDSKDPTDGDSGDQADLLERADDLARMDRRITEIGHLLVGSRPGAEEDLHGPEDGTVVTLRFADGTVSTFRVVAITEEVSEDRQDEVLTVDSPSAGPSPVAVWATQSPTASQTARLRPRWWRCNRRACPGRNPRGAQIRSPTRSPRLHARSADGCSHCRRPRPPSRLPPVLRQPSGRSFSRWA